MSDFLEGIVLLLAISAFASAFTGSLSIGAGAFCTFLTLLIPLYIAPDLVIEIMDNAHWAFMGFFFIGLWVGYAFGIYKLLERYNAEDIA